MILGVTGHQDIGSPETVAWVVQAIQDYVASVSIERGISCLARGADQLFADILRQRSIPYWAVIASADYETTFSTPESLETHRQLREHAARVIELDHAEASEQAYYDAGIKLVDLSTALLAVWNGQPARGLGGTGDIVKYARSVDKPVFHINPETHTTTQIG